MFNPSAVTLGELGSFIRDLSIFTGLVILGWKGRSWVQAIIDVFSEAKDFFPEARKHMIVMETSMDALLNNHLSHLKNDEPETKIEL